MYLAMPIASQHIPPHPLPPPRGALSITGVYIYTLILVVIGLLLHCIQVCLCRLSAPISHLLLTSTAHALFLPASSLGSRC